MSGNKIKLTGWKAVVAIVIFIGILGIRFTTLSDEIDDKDLMNELELIIMTDYTPNDVDELTAAYESGNMDETTRLVDSIASTKLNIESVKASYPIFSFSTNKEVVVKVTYSLNDDSGTRDKKTNYYRFKHGSLLNSWQYNFESNVVSYYLNFI